ncbi:MerR family transcriptional regulator [Pseudomonas sp. LRF_L74]|uniref:MerR family transcriptional regulator n=1 Tax=Pseudomonas sp. LRF_L74 TaxID=3369422 RepID=UPI003F5D88B7
MSLDYQDAIAQGYLPIREVARTTGINPVTLRAWERRYGLVVPYRTPKGHRLYSPEHVQRIQAILSWLDRGVAVSQVRDLLEERAPQTQPRNEDGDWQQRRDSLLQCIAQQAERALEEAFNRLTSLYPPRTLCEHLLLPLLDELDQRWRQQALGLQLEQAFFHTWLRSKLGARIQHARRQASGAPLLLVGIGSRSMEAGLWLSAWLTTSAECPVQVIEGPLSASELAVAQEHLAPRALVLYASQQLEDRYIQRDLPQLLRADQAPLILAGPASHIHQQALQELTGLHRANDPLALQLRLQELGLFSE